MFNFVFVKKIFNKIKPLTEIYRDRQKISFIKNKYLHQICSLYIVKKRNEIKQHRTCISNKSIDSISWGKISNTKHIENFKK